MPSNSPKDHSLRLVLHNEVHARPPHPIAPPLHIVHRVMVCSAAQREQSREHLNQILRAHHAPIPDAGSGHVRAQLGGWLLRWEMHTEFVTWTFSRNLSDFDNMSAWQQHLHAQVPAHWIDGLPGSQLVHHHLWVLSALDHGALQDDLVKCLLHEDTLVGSVLAQGTAQLLTDLSIHGHGESREMVFAGEIEPRRLGRLVQQLLEIETYRMAALLGLPVAREASAELSKAEAELGDLALQIRSAKREEEADLLDRLTRLAAQVEGRYASTHSRFSASKAYFELVDERIRDLAEQPLGNLQTLGAFLHRRLTPARNTCAWVSNREDALSQRISRMSSLLRTRVEIEQQQGTQALLDAMAQRQALQLRLQSTVEGLSVAAITYYVVGLLGYLIKGLKPHDWPLSAEATLALTVPVVALLVWWSLRRLHHTIFSRLHAPEER